MSAFTTQKNDTVIKSNYGINGTNGINKGDMEKEFK